MKRLGILVAAISCSASSLFSQAQFVPVGNLHISGGQNLYNDKDRKGVWKPDSVGSELSFLVSPSIVLESGNKIIPTYSGSYRNVRLVEEIAGGGFLTSEVANFFAGLKYTRKLGPSPWTLKPFVSFKLEYIVESTDESLGSGLFDWWKYSTGVELEREGDTWKSQRFTLAYYGTQFPNYRSLASTSLFGSELNTGTKVLNFKAIDAAYGADVSISDRLLSYGAALISHRPYDDQNIVTAAGTYENNKRTDLFSMAGGGIYYAIGQYEPFGVPLKVFVNPGLQYAMLDSDQNSFDATRTKFTPGYYDYNDLITHASFSFHIGNKQKASLGYQYKWRTYTDRLVQDTAGAYHDGLSGMPNEKVLQNFRTVTLQYSYLIGNMGWGDLNANFSGSYQKAKSNMAYEVSYRYNYEAAHYFTGLALEFGGK